MIVRYTRNSYGTQELSSDSICAKSARVAGDGKLRVMLVNVRYTEKIEHREFTALITASAMDHYVDEESSGEFP